MTKNQRSFDSAVMMSSLIPSEKYSCSGSPLMLMKGSTAIAGRSGRGSAGACCFSADGAAAAVLSAVSVTSPTKRTPLRADGADQPLRLAAVVDGAPCRIDPAGQRRFGDDAAVPDRIEQVVAGHHAVAVRDQIEQQVEHLRFDGDKRIRPAQFATGGIEHEILKLECHASAPSIRSARERSGLPRKNQCHLKVK